MADDQDQEQKTEPPSSKRLEEAYQKGNVPFSREVSSFFMMAMLAFTVTWFAPSMLINATHMLTPFLSDAEGIPTDKAGISHIFSRVGFGGMGIIAGPLVCAIIAALSASILQNGIRLSNEPLIPKLERLSPLAGIKRMFSMRSVMELLKGIVKITIVGFVGFICIYPELPHVKRLLDSNTQAMLLFLALLAKRMTIGIAIAMFFIALFDILWQRYQFIKSLRMSKQELKDEYKQSEGDPMIKMRLRRLRMQRAKNRMMSNVPKADVVITNPTHFAIALQYDSKTMKAPLVVAKGQDLIALKIRDIAKDNHIPVVENPPLARALFASTEIDQEIPLVHYEAVAKIISYVYQLKGKKL